MGFGDLAVVIDNQYGRHRDQAPAKVLRGSELIMASTS